MKKLLFVFVTSFVYVCNVFAQPNLADFRFSLGSSANLKIDHYHDWKNFTSFVEISPTGHYTLVEIGPKVSVGPATLKLRTGLNISASEQGAKYLDQNAVVIFVNWKNFKLLSVNEITDIDLNKFFHWGTDQYYFEHDLSWKFISAHLEAVWWGSGYKPFFGPTISLPVGPGHLVLWPAWGWKGGQGLAGVEYNIWF